MSAPDSPDPPDRLDLTGYLGRQRWFAGKGRTWQVAGTSTVGELAPGVRIDTVTVTYDDGGTETYQLPLVAYANARRSTSRTPSSARRRAPDGRRRHLYDALHDKDAHRALDRGHRRGAHRRRPGLPPRPHAHRAPTRRPLDRRRGRAEQHLGHLRRHGDPQGLPQGLAGHQPRHRGARGPRRCREHAHRGAARLARGQLDRCDRRATRSRRAWRWPRRSSRAPPTAGSSPSPASATSTPRRTCTPTRWAATSPGEAQRLGAATAEVHAALAAALPTGRLEGKDLDDLADGMRTRLERTAAEVAELTPYVARAAHAPSTTWPRWTTPVAVQRVHGDFHLGQVMRTLEGWKLLDFEGEPARPLAERRGARVAGQGRRRDAALLRLRGAAPARRPPARRAARVPRHRVGRAEPGRLLRRAMPGPAAPTRARSPCCCARSRPTRRSTRCCTRPATGRPGCRSRWRRSAGSPPETTE